MDQSSRFLMRLGPAITAVKTMAKEVAELSAEQEAEPNEGALRNIGESWRAVKKRLNVLEGQLRSLRAIFYISRVEDQEYEDQLELLAEGAAELREDVDNSYNYYLTISQARDGSGNFQRSAHYY